MIAVPMKVSVVGAEIPATVSVSEVPLPVGVGVAFVNGQGRPYTERYEATPTNEIQVFQTKGLIMNKNFVVNPIPSNYGLVTYNGSTITIT